MTDQDNENEVRTAWLKDEPHGGEWVRVIVKRVANGWAEVSPMFQSDAPWANARVPEGVLRDEKGDV